MIAEDLIKETYEFSSQIDNIKFSGKVAYVYNPLNYARLPHQMYLRKWANSKKKVLFMGMNPGPFGMAQTGVPFGEINLVKDWIGVYDIVEKPDKEHPKKPIEGFQCSRSEVSGKRLWGFFKNKFGSANIFFKNHFVLNYCPLLFLEACGRNLTPDKLSKSQSRVLYNLCDEYLRYVVKKLEIEFLIAIGCFAENQAINALKSYPSISVIRILHPSPASPLANKNWESKALLTLQESGIMR